MHGESLILYREVSSHPYSSQAYLCTPHNTNRRHHRIVHDPLAPDEKGGSSIFLAVVCPNKSAFEADTDWSHNDISGCLKLSTSTGGAVINPPLRTHLLEQAILHDLPIVASTPHQQVNNRLNLEVVNLLISVKLGSKRNPNRI